MIVAVGDKQECFGSRGFTALNEKGYTCHDIPSLGALQGFDEV